MNMSLHGAKKIIGTMVEFSTRKFAPVPLSASSVQTLGPARTLYILVFFIVCLSFLATLLNGVTIRQEEGFYTGIFLVIGAVGVFRIYLHLRVPHAVLSITLSDAVLALFIVAFPLNHLQYNMAAMRSVDITPLVEHADQLLQFNWYDLMVNLDHQDEILSLLRYAYFSVSGQFMAVIICLCVIQKYDEIYRLLSYLMTGAALTSLFFGFFNVDSLAAAQAANTGIAHLPSGAMPGYLEQLHAIRSGMLKVIDVKDMTGLVSFPSFHVQIALFLAIAFRRVPLLAIPALLLNVLMIVGAITEGGHYLTDILGGIAFSVMVVSLVSKLEAVPFQRPSLKPISTSVGSAAG